MNKYTIYCTKEQTKKALELGVPIETIPCKPYIIEGRHDYFTDGKFIYLFPTAEQMIGWLEKQRLAINVTNHNGNYDWSVSAPKEVSSSYYYRVQEGVRYYNTRPEATLAAIDAALEHLSKKVIIKKYSMIYSKNFRWGIGIQSFGPKAYTVSKVYKPGIRCFTAKTEGLFHFTIVGKTHRFMLMFPYKKALGESCG